MPKQNYLATDAQVASLARDYLTGADASAKATHTYLQILTAHSLQELNKSSHKRHSAAEALGAVETAHSHLYAVVTEAVVTADVLAEPGLNDLERRRRTTERNRRTTFARSSKATLAGFVKAGGRLASLDPATVTRATLTETIRAARAGPASVAEQVTAASGRLESLLHKLAAESPEAAQAALDDLQHKLQAVVTPPKQMRGRRKVGNITLQAEA